MLSRLWQYIAAAGAALAAILYGLLRYRTHQRDQAREDAARHERNTETVQRIREKEGNIDRARSEARKEAADVADEEANRRAAGDRPTDWGDPRLRDKD